MNSTSHPKSDSSVVAVLKQARVSLAEHRCGTGSCHCCRSIAVIDGVLDRRGIYVASKVVHAPMWRGLRHSGAPIVSTWIDEAGEGQTADYAELSVRCLSEIASASAVVLYCEDGEVLKGALLEVGAALAFGVPVYCVGTCGSISRVFVEHPLWVACDSIEDAIAKTTWKEC